jgi:hypothetical protein
MKKIGIAFIGLVILTMLLVPKVANAGEIDDYIAACSQDLDDLLKEAQYDIDKSLEYGILFHKTFPRLPPDVYIDPSIQ